MRRTIAALVCLGAVALPAGQHALAGDARTLRADVTLKGEKDGDAAGFQVELADLDGDRIDDLVVGAWQSDEGGEASGAIYVEYGPIRKSASLESADAKLFTKASGEYVGEGPLGLADMDGDGADDLVIGAPGSFFATQPGSPGKVGEAFLLYGGRRLRGSLDLAKAADARFTGIHMTEWLGFGSSGVGDLDDDGYEDMLVGAPATAGFSGAAYLFYGAKKRLEGDVPVTAADAIFVGGRPAEMFGFEAAGGDVDDDGDDELFVASKPLAGGPATVSMFSGGERFSGVTPAPAAFSQIFFPTIDYFTGPALSADGDLTGDGVDDLAVGIGVGLNPVATPTTYVFGGSDSAFTAGPGPGPEIARATGTGEDVAIGDVNGDGRADLVTGAPYGSEGGDVHVFFGPLRTETLALTDARKSFTGESASEAGLSLAIGNVGGDRRNDVAIGAPGGAGRVYISFGRR